MLLFSFFLLSVGTLAADQCESPQSTPATWEQIQEYGDRGELNRMVRSAEGTKQYMALKEMVRDSLGHLKHEGETRLVFT